MYTLNGKLNSLSTQKGIQISSSSFQNSIIDCAKKYCLTLIQLTESETIYELIEQLNLISGSTCINDAYSSSVYLRKENT